MIIMLVSHGMLCNGMNDAFHMVASNATNVRAIGLTDIGIEDFRSRLSAAVDEALEKGDVLILADLKGGTPYNESYVCYLKNPEHIRLAAGLNLPMLLEAGILSLSCDDLESVYQTALAAGASGVVGTNPTTEDSSDEEEDLF